MPKSSSQKLGDVIAENDSAMLDTAFFETPDYLALLGIVESSIIVGRRGTGKSAIFYKLSNLWSNDKKLILINISPEDHHLIGIRHFLYKFDKNPHIARAVSKISWRYALINEVAIKLQSHYKADGLSSTLTLLRHVLIWRKHGNCLFSRLQSLLKEKLTASESDDLLPSILARDLEIDSLEEELNILLSKLKINARILIDRLDEGYEPGPINAAMVGGLATSTITCNFAIHNFHSYVFIRDNVARELATHDPDYSRNFESKILRLHWDEQQLFYFICKRLRLAFGLTDERDLKIWEKVTAQNLRGKSGFRKCLQLTLYRPRDLIVLLNKAFYQSQKNNRIHIDNSDIEFSAQDISYNRKLDLIKEYEASLIGIESYIEVFSNGKANFAYIDACNKISQKINVEDISPVENQHYNIIGETEGVVKQLYSVGFIGIKNPQGSSFIFSHDGKQHAQDFREDTELLIHPCYWMSLNLQTDFFDENQSQEIHDDLDIEVTTETTEIRKKRIGQILSDYDKIPEGINGAPDFEEWCEQVPKILFAGGLENIELHPNKNATQRRDVVGTNTESTDFWKRILNDYQARQVIFEVKNFSHDLAADEYRQMNSYLCKSYGRIGFIITRAQKADLLRDRELRWMKEIYYAQNKLIVKITGKMLCSLLSKQRSPQKFRTTETKFKGLLDRYERLYLSI